MKKSYLIVLSLFSVCTINAQVSFPDVQETSKTARLVRTKAKAPKVINVEKASYLSQDFETWPLAGWSISSGPGSNITVPADQTWHSEANGNPGNCASVLYVNSVDTHNEFLTTPDVTLPAAGAFRLAFDFNTSIFWHVSPNDNADITLVASTDGGTTWSAPLWQEDNDALLAAAYCEDWEQFVWTRAFVNVSAYAGMTVRFRFVYFGIDGAQFNLDNVEVEDIPENNLAVLKSYSGDIVNEFDYSKVPVSQVKPMIIGTVVRNLGALSQTDKELIASITFDGDVVYADTVGVTLASGQVDTLWFETGYTPTALGNYWCNFVLEGDDENLDNADSSVVETTSFIYANDFGVDGEGGGFDEDEEHAIASGYIMTVAQNLTGVQVKFEEGTTEDIEVTIRVSTYANQDFVYEELYTIPATEIGTTAFSSLVFSDPVPLMADGAYLIQVRKPAGAENELRLAGSDAGNDDVSTLVQLPDEDGVPTWFTTNFSPYIRANFDPSLSVSTLVDVKGVNVYPNPSEGIVTISNDLNEENTITVLDMTGKVVLTKVTSSATTVDLSKVGTGVYLVEVSNENGKKVERVVIR